MLTVNVPIDDYIDKTFKIQEEDMIVLPKRVNDHKKEINISLNLEDSNNSLKDIDGDLLSALSDGFINGFIEGYKDITKKLLELEYSYDDIQEITNLSLESINIIENEL